VDAIKLLAKTEGIWTEPAGGTTLAATIKLIESGRIPRDESICVSITGNGLKTTEVVVDHLTPPQSIPPKLEAFDRVVSGAAARESSPAVLAGAGV
jgi:threonine synthase